METQILSFLREKSNPIFIYGETILFFFLKKKEKKKEHPYAGVETATTSWRAMSWTKWPECISWQISKVNSSYSRDGVFGFRFWLFLKTLSKVIEFQEK